MIVRSYAQDTSRDARPWSVVSSTITVKRESTTEHGVGSVRFKTYRSQSMKTIPTDLHMIEHDLTGYGNIELYPIADVHQGARNLNTKS